MTYNKWYPKLSDEKDRIEVEYCFSGFMGYPLNVFIWNGNNMLACMARNEKGEWVVRPGMKFSKNKLKMTFALKCWEWLQRRVPEWLEQL